jgi:hypothetical protein
MSSYFFQRIKNVPTIATNSNNNTSRLIQQTTTKAEVIQELTDDELLASALKLEQEEAKKVKGEHIFCFFLNLRALKHLHI